MEWYAAMHPVVEEAEGEPRDDGLHGEGPLRRRRGQHRLARQAEQVDGAHRDEVPAEGSGELGAQEVVGDVGQGLGVGVEAHRGVTGPPRLEGQQDRRGAEADRGAGHGDGHARCGQADPDDEGRQQDAREDRPDEQLRSHRRPPSAPRRSVSPPHRTSHTPWREAYCKHTAWSPLSVVEGEGGPTGRPSERDWRTGVEGVEGVEAGSRG